MNSDRELLELAAKAAGIEIMDWYGDRFSCRNKFDAELFSWNPLTDDGDALRLMVRLNIRVDPNVIDVGGETTNRTFVDFVGGEFTAPHNNDPYAATRRAIVRAAAEIGKSM